MENSQNELKLFENKKIRYVWNADEEEWYFSVVDVIEVLTGTDRPRKYWNDLKKKLLFEGSELSEKIGQLKLLAPDGKMRETDVLSTKNILRLIQSKNISRRRSVKYYFQKSKSFSLRPIFFALKTGISFRPAFLSSFRCFV